MCPTADLSSWYFFNCVGSKCDRSIIPIKANSNTLPLFGYTFDYSSSFLSELNFLFKLAQQKLMLLESGPRLHERDMGSSLANTVSDTEYYNSIRKEICEFLFHVKYYIKTVSENVDSYAWLIENLAEFISKNLAAFHCLVKQFCSVPLNHQSQTISHHKEHAKFEICWYHIQILLDLDSCKSKAGLLQDTQTFEIQTSSVKKYVELLLFDMLTIAKRRFKTLVGQSEFLNKTPFRCICTKKIWVMIIRLLDENHQETQHGKSFWLCLNEQLCNMTNSNKQPEINGDLVVSSLDLHDPNFELFKLWVLTNLAMLYKQEQIPIMENYQELEAIVKVYVPPDSLISEEHLRITISFVTRLVTELWPPKSEAVTALWEYYHRRLNTSFLLPDSETDKSFQLTPKHRLNRVKSWLECPTNSVENENSYCLFLRLLGLHVKCSEKKHWNQLRGRIYSKFSPTKLQSLTDEGLFNFSSLFFTLCIAVNLKEVGEKFIGLLLLLTPSDNRQKRIVFRVKLMLIKLFVSEGLEIEELSKPLVEELNCVSRDTSSSAVQIFLEEVQSFPEIGSYLVIFIDCWVPQYLSSCSETDSNTMYVTLLALAKSVSEDCLNDPSPRSRKMAEVLWDQTLRCLLTASNDSFDVEASYGMELTLLTLRIPSGSITLATIFSRFINSPTLSVKISVRYLYLFMTEQIAMSALKSRMDNYQGLLIRAWLKCVVLSTEDNFKNLSTLTEQVAKLPDFEQLTGGAHVFTDSQDPLIPFLMVISKTNATLASRISFYTSPVEDWLTRSTMKNGSVAIRIYKCAALFIVHAPKLAYNKSSSNLVTKVVANLLLPKTLMTGACKLGAFETAALTDTIDIFFRGLVEIGAKNDEYIKKCLKEIIMQYFPRLVPRATTSGGNLNSFLSSSEDLHPLIRIFDHPQEEARATVVSLVASSFVTCKATTPHVQATPALRFLRTALLRMGDGGATLITRHALANVLEVVMFAPEGVPAHRAAIELLNNLLGQDDDTLRQAQADVIAGVAKKHLAFSAAYAWALFDRLARLDSRLVVLALPQIRAEVRSVEQRRGGGLDRGLQAGLAKVEKTIREQ